MGTFWCLPVLPNSAPIAASLRGLPPRAGWGLGGHSSPSLTSDPHNLSRKQEIVAPGRFLKNEEGLSPRRPPAPLLSSLRLRSGPRPIAGSLVGEGGAQLCDKTSVPAPVARSASPGADPHSVPGCGEGWRGGLSLCATGLLLGRWRGRQARGRVYAARPAERPRDFPISPAEHPHKTRRCPDGQPFFHSWSKSRGPVSEHLLVLRSARISFWTFCPYL